jgi:DNA mismatch endonuclease (patch repair protein)
MTREEKREYIRDGRAPVPESEVTSRVMRSNKGKDTKPEIIMRLSLREMGLHGYRLHWKKVPGRPDIAFPGRKIAIFVNGCYWHRCPICDLKLPKSNTDFWKAKFERNKARDEKKRNDLEELGWKVFAIWECEINEDPSNCALRIKRYIDSQD